MSSKRGCQIIDAIKVFAVGQGDGEGVMVPLASVSSTSVLPCATHSPDARLPSTWSSPVAITLAETVVQQLEGTQISHS